MTLQEAVTDLHRVAVVEELTQSPQRLQGLATYCTQELNRRGVEGAEREATIPGAGRPKGWDVAWKFQDKYRLAISLKSILRNLAGTVPNRIDDLMGETANVQLHSPEIVVGYMMVFDVSTDQRSERRGGTWCDLIAERLVKLSGRKPPAWSIGMVEASALIRVDFGSGPRLLTAEADVAPFFDSLVEQVRSRNPSLR